MNYFNNNFFFSKHLAVFPKFYMHTQYRISQYLIGILTGYIIFQCNKHKVKVNKLIAIIGWTFSIGFLLSHIFKNFHPKSVIGKQIYASIYRELWACAICWMIFGCHVLKSGGVIRKFLSLNFWQPLSKISLSVYLIHYIYLMLMHTNQKDVSMYYSWLQIHLSFADVVISFIFSGIFFLFVEAPMMNLTNSFWESRKVNFKI